MVIEHFKEGRTESVRERFQRRGRMLPPGVAYRASWVDATGSRCFQVMETADRELLDLWAGFWNDLIDFEIIAVVASEEFWQRV
jgi:hypothetical protein